MLDHIKLYKEFTNENKKEHKFSYGCAMLDFNFPDMEEIHESIDKDDLYKGEEGDTRNYGLEKDPHITLLYGIHSDEVSDKEVIDICKSITYKKIKLHNASLFENEKYDVLKFDVSSTSLHQANKKLTDKLPYTTDFPDYHPHCTISYIKKGKGKDYVKKFEDLEYKVTPKAILYSKPDGDKIHSKIEMTHKKS